MADIATADDAPRSTHELLDTLPQELYDKIYKEVFTAGDGNVVVVHKDHKPPAALQVDSASRENFAESYYNNSIFVLSWEKSYRFVHCLTEYDTIFIRDVRAPFSLDLDQRSLHKRSYRSNWDTLEEYGCLLLFMEEADMWRELVKQGVAIETETEFICNGTSIDKSSLGNADRGRWGFQKSVFQASRE